jgi:hypothetical protein
VTWSPFLVIKIENKGIFEQHNRNKNNGETKSYPIGITLFELGKYYQNIW